MNSLTSGSGAPVRTAYKVLDLSTTSRDFGHLGAGDNHEMP